MSKSNSRNVLELFLLCILGFSCRCREVGSTPAQAAALWLLAELSRALGGPAAAFPGFFWDTAVPMTPGGFFASCSGFLFLRLSCFTRSSTGCCCSFVVSPQLCFLHLNDSGQVISLYLGRPFWPEELPRSVLKLEPS